MRDLQPRGSVRESGKDGGGTSWVVTMVVQPDGGPPDARRGQGVCIAGTHGKSTTTAMVGWILSESGLDPSVLVGAELVANGRSGRAGNGQLLVVESCEFNHSFLDFQPVARRDSEYRNRTTSIAIPIFRRWFACVCGIREPYPGAMGSCWQMAIVPPAGKLFGMRIRRRTVLGHKPIAIGGRRTSSMHHRERDSTLFTEETAGDRSPCDCMGTIMFKML